MKKLKKLLSIVLAVAMVMSLAVSVTAVDYSIVVTNNDTDSDGYYLHDGETYYAYKVFDLTYDSNNPGVYAYTITKDSAFWSAIVYLSTVTYNDGTSNVTSAECGTEYFKLTQYGTTDTFVVEPQAAATDTTVTPNVLASAIVTKLTDTASTFQTSNANGSAVLTDGVATIELDDPEDGPGYYYVTTTVGSAVEITNVAPTGQVKDKNTDPTADKEVYNAEGKPEDSNSDYDYDSTSWGSTSNAQIGDVVYFQTTIDNIADISKLTLHDALDDGLKLDGDSIKVYFVADSTGTFTLGGTGSVTLTSSCYSVNTTTNLTHTDPSFTCDFEVKLDDFLADSTYSSQITSDSIIVVTYSATVTDDAVVYNSTNNNETYVSFGDSSYSESSLTSTYTYKMTIFKYTGTDTALEGVKFKLYYYENNDTDTDPIYVNTTYDANSGTATQGYYVVDESDSTTKTETSAKVLTTGSDGYIKIYGLDSDKIYYLVETETLSGYNLLTSPVEVQIESDNQFAYSSKTNQERVEIQNNTGTTLAETGGIGVTIFYVVGGILVLAAAGVIVISKKRRTEK